MRYLLLILVTVLTSVAPIGAKTTLAGYPYIHCIAYGEFVQGAYAKSGIEIANKRWSERAKDPLFQNGIKLIHNTQIPKPKGLNIDGFNKAIDEAGKAFEIEFQDNKNETGYNSRSKMIISDICMY